MYTQNVQSTHKIMYTQINYTMNIQRYLIHIQNIQYVQKKYLMHTQAIQYTQNTFNL